jgi:hypothetical protein
LGERKADMTFEATTFDRKVSDGFVSMDEGSVGLGTAAMEHVFDVFTTMDATDQMIAAAALLDAQRSKGGRIAICF